MKVIIRSKKFMESVVREGCYCLKRHHMIYWNGKPITSKEQYKSTLQQQFHSPIDIKKSDEIEILITPFIQMKDLHRIIDRY